MYEQIHIVLFFFFLQNFKPLLKPHNMRLFFF